MTVWASVADHIETAETFYGDTAQHRVAEWIAREEDLVGNAAFATHFSSHFNAYSASPADYTHRKVRSRNGALLGGIRFFGGDTRRPFVDVIAHDFDAGPDGYAALRACVAEEWKAFSPRYVRLFVSAARFARMKADVPSARLDQGVFVARCGHMNSPDGRVAMKRFDAASDAMALVDAGYKALADTDPDLAKDVEPSDPNDLQEMWQAGRLHAISVEGQTVGALAVAPSRRAWIEGAEVMEEVVAPAYAGHGYAASAQMAWAANHGDAGTLLFGTIDGANHASQKTAERAGRPMVLAYVFVDLPRV